MSLLQRARPELVALKPYASARRSGFKARIRLDANELPWDELDDERSESLNRYPEPQPERLRKRIAALYGIAAERLWIGRGSDEAIDLLLRAFCRAGHDNVVALAPSFGMYRIGATVHDARFRAVTLDPSADFALDQDVLLAQIDADTKLVFLCSPNNPSGTLFHQHIDSLASALASRALLVVDEAYIEFADAVSACGLLDRHANLAVLRTLSKAHGLAGARIGSLIADEEIVDLVARIAPPYPLPAPSVRAGLRVLEPAALERTRERIALLVRERERMRAMLANLPAVRKVWPSFGNFLLLRFADSRRAFERLLAHDILVRDFSSQPGLDNCLRISIGTQADNDAVLAALAGASP